MPLTPAPLHRDFDRFKEKVRCQMSAIPICTARTNALCCSIHELVAELEERIEERRAVRQSQANQNRGSNIRRHESARQIYGRAMPTMRWKLPLTTIC